MSAIDEINAMRVGLDQLAAWVDAHPDIPLHRSGATWIVADHRMDDPDHGEIVRAIADGAPIGTITKKVGASDTILFVERAFAGGVKLQHQAARDEVCERRVVGVETVEVPDPDAPLVTIEREIVEWDCKPLLATEGQR